MLSELVQGTTPNAPVTASRPKSPTPRPPSPQPIPTLSISLPEPSPLETSEDLCYTDSGAIDYYVEPTIPTPKGIKIVSKKYFLEKFMF